MHITVLFIMIFNRAHFLLPFLLFTLACSSVEVPISPGNGVYLQFVAIEPESLSLLNLTDNGRKSIEVIVQGDTVSGNQDIEERIRTYLAQTNGFSYDVGSILFSVNYTQDICKSIRITSGSSVFGRQPGEDLSDLFLIKGYTGWNSLFLISPLEIVSDKEREWIPIEEYLSYSPYLFTDFLLAPDDADAAPDAGEFSVEIGLDDGRFIR